jgi:hypothetical protein
VRGDDGLRWTTSHSCPDLVLDVGSNLAEGIGTSERSDAHDRLSVGPQHALQPPCRNSLRHAAQVLVDADSITRVPGDELIALIPLQERRGAVPWVHAIRGDKWDPGSYSP